MPARVFDADAAARELLENDIRVREAVYAAFGPGIAKVPGVSDTSGIAGVGETAEAFGATRGAEAADVAEALKALKALEAAKAAGAAGSIELADAADATGLPNAATDAADEPHAPHATHGTPAIGAAGETPTGNPAGESDAANPAKPTGPADVSNPATATAAAAALAATVPIDRARLREIVFRDERQRRKLEAILHPEIRARWAKLAEETRREGTWLLVDIPLLFETGAEIAFDGVVVVACSAATQRARLVLNRGLTDAMADRIIASQQSLASKVARAAHVIWSDCPLPRLEEQARIFAGYLQTW